MRGVAVPYIIALILGILVVGLLAYYFIYIANKVPKVECDTRIGSYCTQWKTLGFGTSRPATQDFTGCSIYYDLTNGVPTLAACQMAGVTP